MKKIFLFVVLTTLLISCSKKVGNVQLETEDVNNKINTQLVENINAIKEGSEKGDRAIDFTLMREDGTNFVLSEHRGKPVYINFWATWCGPCVEELPMLQKLYEEYKDRVEFIFIDCGEDRTVVDKFKKQNNYTFPVLYDSRIDASIKYKIEGIPVNMTIDSRGIIDNKIIGSMGGSQQERNLREMIEQVLAK